MLPAAEMVEARKSLGGESLTGVQTQALAVEHRVVDYRGNEFRKLLRAAQPFREGGILGQCGGEFVGDAFGQPGGEQARRDRQHPDAQRAQVTGHVRHMPAIPALAAV